MKIHLKYTAVLNIRGAASDTDITVDEGTTVNGLLDLLGVRKEHQRFVLVSVNGVKQGPSAVIPDGGDVSLSLPIGGG